MRYLSGRVQLQILAEYKARLPSGAYRYRLKEIAQRHEVSLGTINNLAREADCPRRPHGTRAEPVPDARIMKILRDWTEPGITLEEVGRRNPRVVNGLVKPLTRQRVQQIIATWRRRGLRVRSRAFKRHDLIEWGGATYEVIRYDNRRRGAVRNVKTGHTIDPFQWVQGRTRSRKLEGK
jgi:hypothetical protein